ncbi:hypothetical protein D9756_011160 [Leucocoprinus leucothites]|uniref:DUF3533 domain-containing protein n=1 Tax=Leucocoprinus leucothites TaxID=201217 RepID=A0A8H5CR23_9AGAR|nr:hypothetical protein D9756_011160 [Leucoagaricus leucothites]
MASENKYSDDDFRDQSVHGDHKPTNLVPTEPPSPRVPSAASTCSPKLYQHSFLSSYDAIATARKVYLRVLCGGVFATIIVIFTVFALLWGAFFRTPVNSLPGWVIDFDGGMVGKAVVSGLTTTNPSSKVSWTVLSADQFPNGVSQVASDVSEHKAWITVTVNPGASDRLLSALASPDADYDGSEAVSIFASEARNENAFRVILGPSAETALSMISAQFARHLIPTLTNSSTLVELMTVSPQTLTTPISYRTINLHPFNQPLATVVIFTGLIFVLILSFFIVMIANGAREASDLRRLLNFRSLIVLRFLSAFGAYFIVSLFYSLLSIAFQLDVTHKFGRSGFLVFWMMNYCGMLALGLAIESMLTLLTPTFVPFFLLTWVMVNVSVCVFPIEVLPRVYRYGYAAPFYNISKIARTVVFGVKNQVGFNFSILIIWTLISCATLTIFQYWAHRREVAAAQQTESEKSPVDG